VRKRQIHNLINKEITMIEVIKAIDDRIDWLKAKYRDSEGEDRIYWKTRLNEAQTIRETVLIYGKVNALKGDASDIIKG
jgi:hypothetical protein